MKRIWLTGASSGIGAALAEQLLQQGHQLAISARNVAALEALREAYPQQVLLLPGDLTDSIQVQKLGVQLTQAWSALDQLIINAGTCEYLDASHFEAAMIERVTRVNLFAPAYCIEAALPLLRNSRQPHLVVTGSSVTYFPLPRAEAYGASKAALRYLCQSLRVDLAAEDIAVTLINPGFVDTPLTRVNDFPMPMRWSAEHAAQHIAARLDRRPLEINFPRLFIAGLTLLALLPKSLQLALGKRLARPSTDTQP